MSILAQAVEWGKEAVRIASIGVDEIDAGMLGPGSLKQAHVRDDVSPWKGAARWWQPHQDALVQGVLGEEEGKEERKEETKETKKKKKKKKRKQHLRRTFARMRQSVEWPSKLLKRTHGAVSATPFVRSLRAHLAAGGVDEVQFKVVEKEDEDKVQVREASEGRVWETCDELMPGSALEALTRQTRRHSSAEVTGWEVVEVAGTLGSRSMERGMGPRRVRMDVDGGDLEWVLGVTPQDGDVVAADVKVTVQRRLRLVLERAAKKGNRVGVAMAPSWLPGLVVAGAWNRKLGKEDKPGSVTTSVASTRSFEAANGSAKLELASGMEVLLADDRKSAKAWKSALSSTVEVSKVCKLAVTGTTDSKTGVNSFVAVAQPLWGADTTTSVGVAWSGDKKKGPTFALQSQAKKAPEAVLPKPVVQVAADTESWSMRMVRCFGTPRYGVRGAVSSFLRYPTQNASVFLPSGAGVSLLLVCGDADSAAAPPTLKVTGSDDRTTRMLLPEGVRGFLAV